MKIVVIKLGGSVIDELASGFYQSLNELQNQGYKLVFVHGGGPDINEMLALYNVKPEFVNGLRKTGLDTLKVVEMTLAGQTNRKLVSLLSSHNFNAIGINGSDGKLLNAEFINQEELGYVGEITEVNTNLLQLLIAQNYIPVVTPIGISKDCAKLNINADYAAAAVAKALNAEQCLFVTNVDGVLIEGKLAECLTASEINTYIENGEISGGMIPKVQSALATVEKGVDSVMIVSGKNPFYQNEKWHGTSVTKKEPMIK
ncbi:acetylglutamate kinase [Bacillus sp. DNRA2]|uniref:acetylglutamate kinase n=1 Tax=Bacillus sp. DNRA2 TaxID=2723053 RepID=UPI00145DFE2A|nr:acetylglutamate kinase [Bacillus sp. DNRA2]NMD70811.1 acetylglutamate kinase [Bacillus sp. DNRA2]